MQFEIIDWAIVTGVELILGDINIEEGRVEVVNVLEVNFLSSWLELDESVCLLQGSGIGKVNEMPLAKLVFVFDCFMNVGVAITKIVLNDWLLI